MYRAAALKFLALLGAAAFISVASPKVQAAATWDVASGVQLSICTQFDNGDNLCNPNELQPALDGLAAEYAAVNHVMCFYETQSYSEGHAVATWAAFVTARGALLQQSTGMIYIYPTAYYSSCQNVLDEVAGEGGIGYTAMFGFSVSYLCPGGGHVNDPSSCTTATCQGNIFASLQLKISGPNPSYSEFYSTCFEGCQFDRSEASIYKSGSQYWMKGVWLSTGNNCAAGTDVTGNDEIQDPFGDVVGGGSSTSADGCAESDMSCHETAQETAQAGLLLLKNPGGEVAGVLGGPFQFPTFPWVNAPVGERVCKLDLTLPTHAAFNPLRNWLGGPAIVINFCAYTAKIDLIGGYLLYFATALGLWGIFVRTPGS